MMNANESKVAAPVGGHTPGPWAYSANNADYYGGGQWFDIEAKGKNVLWYAYNSPPERERECEANARLAAAAPDLLAELEREYETLADIRNEWPGRNTSKGQAKLCRLRDLIAKATGRTERDVQDDFSCRAALAKAGGES